MGIDGKQCVVETQQGVQARGYSRRDIHWLPKTRIDSEELSSSHGTNDAPAKLGRGRDAPPQKISNTADALSASVGLAQLPSFTFSYGISAFHSHAATPMRDDDAPVRDAGRLLAKQPHWLERVNYAEGGGKGANDGFDATGAYYRGTIRPRTDGHLSRCPLLRL